MIRVPTVHVILLLAFASPHAGIAQQLAYKPTSDTLRYFSDNTYLLYFVQGADTLGSPVSTRTMESRMATAASGQLLLWVRLKGMGEPPFQAEATYGVSPSGRLLAVGGKPAADVPNARVDLLPRFPSPAPPATTGFRWSDTVSIRGEQPYGPTYYEVQREYQVLRVIDTLGTELAYVVAGGRMRLRQGGWQDEAHKFAWWQEVAGPVVDTLYFDTRRGVVLSSHVVIDLLGTGGAVGGPILASGLRSSVRLSQAPSP